MVKDFTREQKNASAEENALQTAEKKREAQEPINEKSPMSIFLPERTAATSFMKK